MARKRTQKPKPRFVEVELGYFCRRHYRSRRIGHAKVKARVTKTQIIVETGEVLIGSDWLKSRSEWRDGPWCRFDRETGKLIRNTPSPGGWKLLDNWRFVVEPDSEEAKLSAMLSALENEE